MEKHYYCKVCGVEIFRKSARFGRDPQYCSKACYSVVAKPRRHKPKFGETRTCKGCGVTFEAVSKQQYYCNDECVRNRKILKQRKERAQRPPHTVNCECCGKAFECRRYRTLCNDPCKVRPRSIVEKPPKPDRLCAICNNPTTDQKRYCDHGCEQLKKCRGCKQFFTDLTKTTPPKFCCRTCKVDTIGRQAECYECGNIFVALCKHKTFCSEKCARCAAARLRRARKRRVRVETVVRQVLWARDNGICQICNQPIDSTVSTPHPLAFTVDHIIPLSKGGEHSYANCQCAHFLCNSRKSDKVA